MLVAQCKDRFGIEEKRGYVGFGYVHFCYGFGIDVTFFFPATNQLWTRHKQEKNRWADVLSHNWSQWKKGKGFVRYEKNK